MQKQILVLGSINYDLVVTSDHLPAPGETIVNGIFKTYPGGKGANQAVACARMGGKVKMIGNVGRDAYGDMLLATLQMDGIDTCLIDPIVDAATGVALITVDKAGMNTIVVASGANMLVSPGQVLKAESAFKDAGVLVTQLEIPVSAVFEGVRVARSNGVLTILNPAPAAELPLDLLRVVDYLIPNQTELAMLTGKEGVDAGISHLLNIGVGTVIVTLGGDGVILAKRDSRKHFQAHSVKVVDTVAAGDAFVGAFTVGLSEGMTDEHAIQLANAAAAISVTRSGAQPSLPSRVEVDEFLGTNR
jgi:ribokinase